MKIFLLQILIHVSPASYKTTAEVFGLCYSESEGSVVKVGRRILEANSALDLKCCHAGSVLHVEGEVAVLPVGLADQLSLLLVHPEPLTVQVLEHEADVCLFPSEEGHEVWVGAQVYPIVSLIQDSSVTPEQSPGFWESSQYVH